jgi:hypothetical protein
MGVSNPFIGGPHDPGSGRQVARFFMMSGGEWSLCGVRDKSSLALSGGDSQIVGEIAMLPSTDRVAQSREAGGAAFSYPLCASRRRHTLLRLYARKKPALGQKSGGICSSLNDSNQSRQAPSRRQ